MERAIQLSTTLLRCYGGLRTFSSCLTISDTFNPSAYRARRHPAVIVLSDDCVYDRDRRHYIEIYKSTYLVCIVRGMSLATMGLVFYAFLDTKRPQQKFSRTFVNK